MKILEVDSRTEWINKKNMLYISLSTENWLHDRTRAPKYHIKNGQVIIKNDMQASRVDDQLIPKRSYMGNSNIGKVADARLRTTT